MIKITVMIKTVKLLIVIVPCQEIADLALKRSRRAAARTGEEGTGAGAGRGGEGEGEGRAGSGAGTEARTDRRGRSARDVHAVILILKYY